MQLAMRKRRRAHPGPATGVLVRVLLQKCEGDLEIAINQSLTCLYSPPTCDGRQQIFQGPGVYMNKGHDWTNNDDELVCYLHLHARDDAEMRLRIAKYMRSHSNVDKDLKYFKGIISARLGNFKAIDPDSEGGKWGNASNPTRDALRRWKDRHQSEHESWCLKTLDEMCKSREAPC